MMLIKLYLYSGVLFSFWIFYQMTASGTIELIHNHLAEFLRERKIEPTKKRINRLTRITFLTYIVLWLPLLAYLLSSKDK